MNISKTYPNLCQNVNCTNNKLNTNNKSSTYRSSVDANKEGDSTEITREEDEILYQRLKAAGCDLTNFSLEHQKKAIVAFPPLTAPGNVRKSYRLALEKSTPQEKKAAAGMGFYMDIYKKQTEHNTDNDVNGYLNLMKNFKGYFTRYEDALGENQYKLFNSVLDRFTNELSKYKCN